ncbi:hypothetical protein ACK31T_09170 [Aeromonas caviae]|uniref:hypothetical protein n=1 Tax=Aeromonas TaxID=642 RepID=UPI00225B3B6E|nr:MULTISPECIES: hypothetical protein [Aeromonas]MCX4046472.1 hypothetical protein [Aeromonas veronii]WAF67283.1 hypothetical protein NRK98_15255 [Aeromonas dhakensis]HDN9007710.1 hypothetical protein [Aeromonas veronii]
MSKSESGRLVLEIDPDLKRKLYAVLALEQKTLKEWFIESSSSYVKERLKAELDSFGSEKE